AGVRGVDERYAHGRTDRCRRWQRLHRVRRRRAACVAVNMRVHSVNATGSATVTRANSSLLQSIWRRAKQWRHVHLGPVRFSYKFSRRPRLRLPFGQLNTQSADPVTFNDKKSITANQRLDERKDQLAPAIV